MRRLDQFLAKFIDKIVEWFDDFDIRDLPHYVRFFFRDFHQLLVSTPYLLVVAITFTCFLLIADLIPEYSSYLVVSSLPQETYPPTTDAIQQLLYGGAYRNELLTDVDIFIHLKVNDLSWTMERSSNTIKIVFSRPCEFTLMDNAVRITPILDEHNSINRTPPYGPRVYATFFLGILVCAFLPSLF